MRDYLVVTEAKEHPEWWNTPTYRMEANNPKEIRKLIENDGRGLNVVMIMKDTERNRKIVEPLSHI